MCKTKSHPMMCKLHVSLVFYLCAFGFDVVLTSTTSPTTKCHDLVKTTGTKNFLNEIFDKYAKNGSETLSITELTLLMKSMSLGNVVVECEPGDEVCRKSGLVNHHKIEEEGKHHSRKRRKVLDDEDDDENEHHSHWEKHVANCLKPADILELHGISKNENITKEDFLRLGPSLIQQVGNKVCVHEHVKILGHFHGGDSFPTQHQSWGYGILSITIISLLSLSVISLISCLKKSFYHAVMSYLVALAVGTLAGDAMLHLIPHAFAEGANSATSLRLSEEDELKQHYSQVWRALFVLLGIYLFFVVEQLMKAKVLCCKGGHGHSHGNNRGHSAVSQKQSPDLREKSPSLTLSPCSDNSTVCFVKDSVETDDEKAEFVMEVSDDNARVELHTVLSCESDIHSYSKSKEDGHYHVDDRHHHHHHGEKEITKDTNIASVAWMVIVGDGFHNFSDGLAIGAAFSASLSSGLSTAIAVFCHELPHELGDFAILINSGMTIKQAIVYNIMSAILAYFGLAIGILIGEYEMGRHFILSITAGLFLYVSLADMLPELSHQEVPNQSLAVTYLCQHLGIISGIGMMLFISLYEHSM